MESTVFFKKKSVIKTYTTCWKKKIKTKDDTQCSFYDSKQLSQLNFYWVNLGMNCSFFINNFLILKRSILFFCWNSVCHLIQSLLIKSKNVRYKYSKGWQTLNLYVLFESLIFWKIFIFYVSINERFINL